MKPSTSMFPSRYLGTHKNFSVDTHMFRFLSALSQLNVDTSSEVSVFKVVFVQILDKVESLFLQAAVSSDTI